MDKFEVACIALAGRLKVSLVGCDDPGRLLLDAVEKSVDEAGKGGDDAMGKLTALLAAIGAPDPAGGAAKVAALMQQASELEAAMPELASLRDMKAKSDEKAQDEDVSQAVAYHRLPANAVPALKLYRKQDPDGFLKAYPKPTAQQAALSQTLTRPGPNGPTGGPTSLGAGANGNGGPPPEGLPISLEQLQQYEGANITAKAVAFVRSTEAGKTLSWETACERASEFVAKFRKGGALRPASAI